MTEMLKEVNMRLLPVKQNEQFYPMITLFDDFVDRFFDTDRRKGGTMVMDIVEKPGEYVIKANLPGIAKENVSLITDKNQLTIEARQEMKNEEKKDGAVICSERYSGNYRRSLLLPEGCQPEQIKARMEHGVLTLNVPKCQEKPKREIVIE
jgi:HSP20 family protein